uniref:BAALC binder of MAP3K1 and KLF4 n=1 Tax=Gopherus evgoodei TaxID=1825980 RepID=A0A8C4WI52_9SAUR
MGCGGSRADAIEPRYYESWTRETESTWLTNTDTEPPPPACGHESTRAEAGVRDQGPSKNATHTPPAPGSNCFGIINTEKKTSCGTQCTKPTVHAPGTMTQKHNGFRTAEGKWDTKKMSTKEVTINVTKSIRQIDSDRRITKNCVN